MDESGDPLYCGVYGIFSSNDIRLASFPANILIGVENKFGTAAGADGVGFIPCD
jgi:hypothetical protein